MRDLQWKLEQNSRKARLARLDHVDAAERIEAALLVRFAPPTSSGSCQTRRRVRFKPSECRVRMNCLAEASWENPLPTNTLTNSAPHGGSGESRVILSRAAIRARTNSGR